MKLINAITLTSTIVGAEGMNLRSTLFSRNHRDEQSAATEQRALQNDENEYVQTGNCWHKKDEAPPAEAWHPDYSNGWSNGGCTFKRDCDQTGASTQLACCKQYFGGQLSGACLNELPSPPTTSPTKSGGLDVWYPDYSIAWTEAYCINDAPMPSGRPTYSSMLACCKGAYGGQVSGKCISQLPTPPTSSPTQSGGVSDFWYPDYDTAWSEAGCKNEFPLPYANVGDRPNYPTQLECCKGAYGGQVSGACISELPNPPTSSPTGTEGEWYASFMVEGVGWQEGLCSNKRPVPNNVGQSYGSQLECCKGAYPGQSTGACLADLPNPPTASPTSAVGDEWYPSFQIEGVGWNDGVCENSRPVPNNVGQTFSSESACCTGAYNNQESKSCVCKVDTCTSCDCEGPGSWKDGAQQTTITEGSKTLKVWTGSNCQNLYNGKTYYQCDVEDITTPSPTPSPTKRPTA